MNNFKVGEDWKVEGNSKIIYTVKRSFRRNSRLYVEFRRYNLERKYLGLTTYSTILKRMYRYYGRINYEVW